MRTRVLSVEAGIFRPADSGWTEYALGRGAGGSALPFGLRPRLLGELLVEIQVEQREPGELALLHHLQDLLVGEIAGGVRLALRRPARRVVLGDAQQGRRLQGLVEFALERR